MKGEVSGSKLPFPLPAGRRRVSGYPPYGGGWYLSLLLYIDLP